MRQADRQASKERHESASCQDRRGQCVCVCVSVCFFVGICRANQLTNEQSQSLRASTLAVTLSIQDCIPHSFSDPPSSGKSEIFWVEALFLLYPPRSVCPLSWFSRPMATRVGAFTVFPAAFAFAVASIGSTCAVLAILIALVLHPSRQMSRVRVGIYRASSKLRFLRTSFLSFALGA